MAEEASLVFRLRKIDETRNNSPLIILFKKTCKYINYAGHLLILASTVTGCVSMSAFASLVCVLVGITSFEVGIKMCAITARIKKNISPLSRKREKSW